MIPNAKDEAPRSKCCKVCVRKLFMLDFYQRLMHEEDKLDRTSHEVREQKLLDSHNDMQRMLG